MIEIRDARPEDAPAITALANAFIPTTTYTWTERLEPVDERAAWVATRQAAGFPVLVAVAGSADGERGGAPEEVVVGSADGEADEVDEEGEEVGEVVGWASFGDFRDTLRTPGYRITAELTIHVREDQWGRGIGRALMEALEDRARAAGKKVLVAGVDASNVRSIAFHERLGFVETARMPGIGELRGRRLDLVLLQREVDVDGPPNR